MVRRRHRRGLRFTAVSGALGVVATLLAPLSASATHPAVTTKMFNFEDDEVGAAPQGVVATVGAVEVALDPLLGKAFHPKEESKVGLVPNDIWLTAATFEGVVGSNMSATWREASWLGGDRHAMTLRSYGKVSGYLFAISNAVVETRLNLKQKQNQVAIYRSSDDNRIVELKRGDLTGLPVRHFRAEATDRLTPSGTVTDLELSYSDDGLVFTPLLTVTDNEPLPAGGLQYTGGWDDTDATRTAIDDLAATFEPRTALNITTPVDFRVFQRDSADSAAIAVSGTYRLPAGHPPPTAIEARWNGGAWAVLDAGPSGGTFSGLLANRSAGQGPLDVRFADDHAVTSLRRSVGVGDVFVVAGQSNAVGHGWEGQVYQSPPSGLKASMLSADLRWSELRDPFGGGGGSVWPLVATELLEDQDVPVAFVAAAVGGTSISQWQPGIWKYYGSLSDRITLVGGAGAVKAVLFWQGETDTVPNPATGQAMSAADYASRLETFTDGVWADFGVEVVVAQIGPVAVPDDTIDPIRQAQQAAWGSGGHSLRGPVLYDVDLTEDTFGGKRGDGTHFRSTADLQVAAARWWAAMDALFYDGATDGRGPALVSATRNSVGDEVTVTFSDATLPVSLTTGVLPGSGFVVEDGSGSVGVFSVSTTGPSSVRLVLARPLAGSAAMSLGKGNTSAGRAIPTDSTGPRLPADTFVRFPISS